MTDGEGVPEEAAWQPGLEARDLMAEAIDEAVAMILAMVEAERERGVAPGPRLAAELARAVDDRIEDAGRRMTDPERERCGEAASAGLRRRWERLRALRNEAGALAREEAGPARRSVPFESAG